MEAIQHEWFLLQILEIEHVESCKDPRFWHHAGDSLVATVTVQCKSEATEQRIIHSVSWWRILEMDVADS